MQSKTIQAALLAAALSLCSMVGAQPWKATYNNSSVNGDDEGRLVAVDHHGNIYVAGNSYGGTSTKNDILIDSYDATGAERSNFPFAGMDPLTATISPQTLP